MIDILLIYAINELLEEIEQHLTEDDDFWEPVKVTTPTDKLKQVNVDNWDCPLCCEESRLMIKLPCCKGKLCKTCTVNWFEKESCICPFCRKDLRELT